MQPLEDTFHLQFIPSLTGRDPPLTGRDPPSDSERDLMDLSARLGGLGLTNPTTMTSEYSNSQRITAPLSALIVLQTNDPWYRQRRAAGPKDSCEI